MSAWLATFLLTLVIELAVGVPLLGLVERRLGVRVALVVGGNLLTHPIVYTCAALTQSERAILVVPALEVAATIVETVVYARLWGRRPVLPAFFTSAIANGLSLGISLVIWHS